MKREDALKLVELTERRSLNERHFQRPDGQIEVILQHNQNYLSGGKWKKREDYKLSLIGGEIANKSDHIDIKIKGNRVKLGKDWFEIEGLYLDDTLLEQPLNITPTYTDDKVLFSDIFTGIDIELLVTPHRVKETVIIKRNPFIGRFVDGDNLYVKYKTSTKHQFSRVWAKDQRANLDALEKWDKKDYYLGMSRSNLNRSAYPVEIDPTITPIPSADVYMWSGQNTGLADDTNIIVGYHFYDDGKSTINNEEYRSYVRFDLSSVNATVTASTFYAYRWYNSSAGYDHLRQVTAEYNPTTTLQTTLWPAVMGTIIGTLPTGIGWASLALPNVPPIYADTHRGGFCDFGLEGYFGTDADYRNIFYSSSYTDTTLRPYLSVTYGAASGSSIKTINGLAKASVKTVNGVVTASVKTWNGLS